MAANLIPEGYISLKEAFDAFRKAKSKTITLSASEAQNLEECPVEHRDQALRLIANKRTYGDPLDAMIAAFANRELEAFVKLDGSGEIFRLSQESWDEEVQPLTHRPFITGEIGDAVDTSWESAEGCTPFVDEERFTEWLDRQESVEVAQQPVEPDLVGAKEYLRKHADAFLQDKGPRYKHREWLDFAEATFGLSNAKANKIWEKMPDGYRGSAGRPRKK